MNPRFGYSTGVRTERLCQILDSVLILTKSPLCNKSRDFTQDADFTPRSVSSYLTDIDKRLREERKQKIFDMWMACETNEYISESCSISEASTRDEIETFRSFGNASKTAESLANFSDTDFNPPLYNIWTFAKKTTAVTHFGNSEQRITAQNHTDRL